MKDLDGYGMKEGKLVDKGRDGGLKVADLEGGLKRDIDEVMKRYRC